MEEKTGTLWRYFSLRECKQRGHFLQDHLLTPLGENWEMLKLDIILKASHYAIEIGIRWLILSFNEPIHGLNWPLWTKLWPLWTKLWGRTRTQNLTGTYPITSDLDMPLNTDKEIWIRESDSPSRQFWVGARFSISFLPWFDLSYGNLPWYFIDKNNLNWVSEISWLSSGRVFCWDKRQMTQKRHHNNKVSRRNSFGLKSVLLDSLFSDLSHSVVTSNDSINFN